MHFPNVTHARMGNKKSLYLDLAIKNAFIPAKHASMTPGPPFTLINSNTCIIQKHNAGCVLVFTKAFLSYV